MSIPTIVRDPPRGNKVRGNLPQLRTSPHASIPYDRHTLRIDPSAQAVTLWTVIGAQTIPFAADGQLPDDWQRPTLTLVSGNWYLLIIVPGAADVAGEG